MLKRYSHTLQDGLLLTDSRWEYSVANLPTARQSNQAKLVKSVKLVANPNTQALVLEFQNIPTNRAISEYPHDHLVHVTLGNFRLQVSTGESKQPATIRESSDYLTRFLKAGLTINGILYSFYGHSNSQLKSRSCFLLAGSKSDVHLRVESLGDFSKITSVAKKAKRIGLLFSTAHGAVDVPPERCEDIADIENENYIFSDGCGLISPQLARELVKKQPIIFRNQLYNPTVFQIRYRGYKGVVTIEPKLRGKTWLQLRKSMRKFTGTSDLSFAVVDHSKPYTYGYLNDETVLLLHSLAIPTETFRQKQREHFDYLESSQKNAITAFRLLSSTGRVDLAEKLLINGAESITSALRKVITEEYNKMLTKWEEQKCRILITRSRHLFGICDTRNVLEPGQCFLRVTQESDGSARTIMGADVLVARNPCLHPGDLRKLRAVDIPDLHHLVDCIVFSTKGKRPAPDMMSGGDLDGDTFFVCWDPDLVPPTISEPAEYPAGREPVTFRQITDDDRIEYFSRYSSASLGRVRKLFLGWARHNGPLSSQCQELNRLFSQCVDGNRVKVPDRLQDPPPPPPESDHFVLDVLHEDAKAHIKKNRMNPVFLSESNIETVEIILSECVPFSQFEMAKMTLRWCQSHNASFEDFWTFFDPATFSAEERLWLLAQLPPKAETAAFIMNELMKSDLLSPHELQTYRLDYPGLRWKRVFSSHSDRLANLTETIQRTFNLFTRKLLVLQVGDRLSVAIYIPRKIEQQEENVVDDSVRLFAFPHSHANAYGHRRVVPTKITSRLYYDHGGFQLYETKRSNTFVFFARAANDDISYRSIKGRGDRARARQRTIDSGRNCEWIVSIALGKFSDALATQIGRINRDGISAAELYVISNSDTRALRTLDLWLENVDTGKVHTNFEKSHQAFSVPTIADVHWETEPKLVQEVGRDKNFTMLHLPSSIIQIATLLKFAWSKHASDLATEIYRHLLPVPGERSREPLPASSIEEMVAFLHFMPHLVIFFCRLYPWQILPEVCRQELVKSKSQIINALILCANNMEGLITRYFKDVLQEASTISFNGIQAMIETISLVVSSSELALDLFLDGLEPSSANLSTEPSNIVSYLLRCLFGIALEHCDEANEQTSTGKELWKFEPLADPVGATPVLKCHRRIDAPQIDRLATGDHVRFTAASDASNTFFARLVVFEALVESSGLGQVTFRCLRQPPIYVTETSWKLKHCGSYVTPKAMSDAVVKLLSEKEKCCGVYNQIMLTSPGTTSIESSRVAYQPMDDLNPSQNDAVCAALQGPLACLWGPPGTGKTYTIVAFLDVVLQHEPESRVLVTAPTHNAVDNVMRQYIRRISPSKQHLPIPLRVSTDIRKVADDLRKYTCDAMVGKDISQFPAARRKAQQQIRASRLIFTTCVGAGLGLLKDEMFPTVLIDEASQQTEPASLIPLVKGCKRAVLVGDHVQLRATVRKHAQTQDFDISLFERLWKADSNPQNIRKVMLNTQYRMHPEICNFPSAEFYEGKLLTGQTCHKIPFPDSVFKWQTAATAVNQARSGPKRARCVFVQCSTPEDLGNKSKSNEGQAQKCQEIYRGLCSKPLDSSEAQSVSSTAAAAAAPASDFSIAILTPYTRQAQRLRQLCPGATVSSIDGFQGQEADVIVYVTVRCNVHGDTGFLKDMRRLNVALTRARAGIIVIGDMVTLTKNKDEDDSCKVWGRLIAQCTLMERAIEGENAFDGNEVSS